MRTYQKQREKILLSHHFTDREKIAVRKKKHAPNIYTRMKDREERNKAEKKSYSRSSLSHNSVSLRTSELEVEQMKTVPQEKTSGFKPHIQSLKSPRASKKKEDKRCTLSGEETDGAVTGSRRRDFYVSVEKHTVFGGSLLHMLEQRIG